MKATVRVKARHIVRPPSDSSSTKTRQVIKLSELDEVMGAVHVPSIYFYKPTAAAAAANQLEEGQQPNNSIVVMTNTLRESLAQVLAHYYPLAGRIHRLDGGRLELHVGGLEESADDQTGAEMVVAESDSRLSDFEDFSSPVKFQHLIPNLVDYDSSRPTHEVPLLMVQITYLACGAFSFGFLISHAVADGIGVGYFLNDWCRLSRGESLDVYPCHDRKVLRAGEPPKGLVPPSLLSSRLIQQAIQSSSCNQNIQEGMVVETTRTVTCKLTRAQVETLKNAAMATKTCCSDSRPFSRFEVLASHIWRCTCQARGCKSDEYKALGMSADSRHRIRSFPAKYFGNSSFVVAAKTQVGELLSRPLGFACERIREALQAVSEEYVWSEIDFFKNMKDLSVCQELRALSSISRNGGGNGPYIKPDLGVISWLSLPIFNLDFGWGRDIYMSPGEHNFDGVSHILPGRDGEGSVTVLISLQVNHADEFKKHFYQDIISFADQCL